MSSSVLLGTRLRRQIRTQVWPMLQEEGFVEFAPLRAYRIAGNRVELVEFSPFPREWREPRWLGGEAYANGACFALYVGTYALGDGEEKPRPRLHECHWCTKLHHGDVDSPADGRSFSAGLRGERLDQAIESAVSALRERGLDTLRDHGSPRPIHNEVGLSTAEAAEMMRICREGRAARADALDDLHRRLHLVDEHYVNA